jgi:hypothetical protein
MQTQGSGRPKAPARAGLLLNATSTPRHLVVPHGPQENQSVCAANSIDGQVGGGHNSLPVRSMADRFGRPAVRSRGAISGGPSRLALQEDSRGAHNQPADPHRLVSAPVGLCSGRYGQTNSEEGVVPMALGKTAVSDGVSPRAWRRPWLAAVLLLISSGLMSIWVTWPVARFLSTGLPRGYETVPAVPLLNLWTLWWNADRASDGWRDYWHAPIFYPVRSAFVFSEAQPELAILSPLVWLCGPVCAYNVFLLVTLTLNGAVTAGWLRSEGLSLGAAVLAALLTVSLPFIIWQMGVLQLTVLWPAVLTIWLTRVALQTPCWWVGLAWGAAFAFTYASCNYYGLFLVVLLVPAGLCWCCRAICSKRALLTVVLAAMVAGAGVFPIVYEQLAAAREHQWERSDDMLRGLSAQWTDYTDSPWPQWFSGTEWPVEGRINLWTLGPGGGNLMLAAAGLIVGLWYPPSRRRTMFLVVFGGCAFVFSLGPTFELWNGSPYNLLRKAVPGFSAIRSPFRFAVFVQWTTTVLAVSLLDVVVSQRRTSTAAPVMASAAGSSVTATASDLISVGTRSLAQGVAAEATNPSAVASWRSCRLMTWLRNGLALLAAAMLVSECRPLPGVIDPVPSLNPPPLWVEFLRDETPPDDPVVCLPFAYGADVTGFVDITWWMYWSIGHRRWLVNGYSGFFPRVSRQWETVLVNFPNDGGPQLVAAGIPWAVVQRSYATQQQLAQQPGTRDWQWMFSDERAGIDIYQLPVASRPE